MAVILNASTSSGFVQSADTSGEINLQSNGSTKLSVLSTGVSGTLVQGTAVASTSGTSIDFTGIPSWVKRITVMFQGVSTSGTSDWLIQLGDSGGIENTGYLGTGASIQAGTGETLYTAGIGIRSGSAATVANGAVNIFQIISSSNTWVAQGVIGQSNSARMLLIGSGKSLSDTLTQVRITTVNGTDTFDAGTINIQYEG
jgi:hypothetical protein